MRTRLFLTFLAAIPATQGWAQAGRVTTIESRERVIASATALLESAPRARGEVPEARANPFAAVPLRTAVRQEAAPTPVRVNRRLSDDRALIAVARNFDPAGSLITGSRRVLRLRDGSMLGEGETFTARIQGEAYQVTISAVQPGGYVLTIGEASLRRGFLGARRESSPRAPAPESPPPATEP